ncbi:hypothetical protein SAMN05661096_03274 [Marivirga sericea]|uniref:Translation initiation factor IF-2, N-terminal region n=1 Tax=Marivirga sericea TaxID=1028 RepID=A0A1X7KXX4_9BACT|nr:hypothetical protein [Marivirga sericea]SMG46431.1 hypothetical protein SAMN05661096_03274 [Marivirga sericea]
MRLAQAARKLSITTEDIVDFLEIRGISIERDSNTKLDEKAVDLLYKYFEIEEEGEEVLDQNNEKHLEGPPEHVQDDYEEQDHKVALDQSEQIDIDENEKVDSSEEAKARIEDEEISTRKSFKTVHDLLEGEDDNSNEDFVIKAPKVELKGLNVVGKIELPEPKPKSDPEEKKEVNRKPRKPDSKIVSKRSKNKKQKRELSPSEIRKREQDREARKRERVTKEKKKKRKEFYKEKVLKPKQIEQKNRPKKKKSSVEQINLNKKPKPKTALGKFWRWLNT